MEQLYNTGKISKTVDHTQHKHSRKRVDILVTADMTIGCIAEN